MVIWINLQRIQGVSYARWYWEPKYWRCWEPKYWGYGILGVFHTKGIVNPNTEGIENTNTEGVENPHTTLQCGYAWFDSIGQTPL